MKYDTERAVITISVTELCNESLRSGHLDLRYGMGKRFSSARASLGKAVHQRLQREAGALYEAEVSMLHTVFFQGIHFEICGRADGILQTEPVTVDEIKTVGGKAFELPPLPIHSAQVKCYAYFLCRQKGFSTIQTRLTYYCTEDKRIKYHTQLHTVEELEKFFQGLLLRVLYRANILIERQTERLPSVQSGRFPFPSVREGQDILLKECYRDIRAGKRLFAEAPTGIGKTVSTLYPAVRALGDGYCDKIFYLTAKASTGREAFRAAKRIFEAGSHLRTVMLTAREQICCNQMAKCDEGGISRHCNPVDCPRSKDFFERCPAAICDLLQRQSGFLRESIEEIAQKYDICPYELQMELSEFCDIVICDYNYVFDPQVYLRRYFGEDVLRENRYVFLIDEAHNLSDRARAMYSAELKNTDLLPVAELPFLENPLKKEVAKMIAMMRNFRRLCKETLQTDDGGMERGYYLNHGAMESIFQEVSSLRIAVEQWLRLHPTDVESNAVEKLLTKLKRFECISTVYDSAFLTFIEINGDVYSVRLICQDASRVLDVCMARAVSSVLFSATLSPIDYYADILGGGKGAVQLTLPSPYDAQNFCLVALTCVSTRYEDRASSCKKIVSAIAGMASAKRGNYIVYFPSYDYMEKVLAQFQKKYPTVPTVVQTRGMSGADREHFLDAFLEDSVLRIGFCVLGGSFSEGVDLPGKRLIGSMIIGTGLAGISSEQNLLRDYYEVTRERGYDYAYVYPGMNRVFQAAGRVIRREGDRGVVVLVDDRYADARVNGIFPDHWQHIQYAGTSLELAEIVQNFWKKFK